MRRLDSIIMRASEPANPAPITLMWVWDMKLIPLARISGYCMGMTQNRTFLIFYS
jgi:hypothetical protein